MRADGIKPSIIVLNSLINAFGEDQRDTEAFSVLQFMKENVIACFIPPLFCTHGFASMRYTSSQYMYSPEVKFILNLVCINNFIFCL